MEAVNKTVEYINEIKEYLSQDDSKDSIVAFVGAGFSKNAVSKNGAILPDWQQLGEQMKKEILASSDEIIFEEDNSAEALLDVAQIYEDKFGKDRLNKFIEENIRDSEFEPGELHKELLELNWRDIYSTNYDTLLERTDCSGKKYTPVHDMRTMEGVSMHRIIKLHGTIGYNNDYIISRKDYKEYEEKHDGLEKRATVSMVESAVCLIGFSGEDPNFIKWLKWLDENVKRKGFIYICDYFTDERKKKLGEKYGNKIKFVDFSELPGENTDIDYGLAYSKLFILLRRQTYSDILNTVFERIETTEVEFSELIIKNITSASDEYIAMLEKLLKEFEEYFKDVFVLQKSESDEISRFISKNLRHIIDLPDFNQKILFADRLCSILNRCNYLVLGNSEELLRDIVLNDEYPLLDICNIVLYLMRIYRIGSLLEEYMHIKAKYEDTINNLEEKIRNDFYIEFSKFEICQFRYDDALEYIQKIECSNAEYEMKKKNLLIESNNHEHIIRQQENKEWNYKSVNPKSFYNLLRRINRDYPDKWEFKDNKGIDCNEILNEWKTAILEDVLDSRIYDSNKKNKFKTNVIVHSSYGGKINPNKKIIDYYSFILLQDSLCIGFKPGLYEANCQTYSALESISEPSRWMWYRILETRNINTIEEYFSKERIYNSNVEDIRGFYKDIVERIRIIINRTIDARAIILLKALIKVSSRITVILPSENIGEYIDLLVEVDNAVTEYSSTKTEMIYEALDIVISSLDDKMYSKLLRYAIDGKLKDYECISRLVNVEMEPAVFDLDINNIAEELASEDKDVRSNAICKGVIFEDKIKNSTDNTKITDLIWEKTDEQGFPLNSNIIKSYWLKSYRSDGIVETLKKYLLNPEIERTYTAGKISLKAKGDVQVKEYYKVITDIIKYKNTLLSMDDINHIVKYFMEHISNESALLEPPHNIMGIDSFIRMRFNSINKIIIILAMLAVRQYREEPFEWFGKYISLMAEKGVECNYIKGIIDGENTDDIILKIEDNFLFEDDNISMIYAMLNGIALFGAENAEKEKIICILEKTPFMGMEKCCKFIGELSGSHVYRIYLDEKFSDRFIRILYRCYRKFENDKSNKIAIDGMCNISRLAKYYYTALQANKQDIPELLDELIEKFNENTLNEVRVRWENI